MEEDPAAAERAAEDEDAERLVHQVRQERPEHARQDHGPGAEPVREQVPDEKPCEEVEEDEHRGSGGQARCVTAGSPVRPSNRSWYPSGKVSVMESGEKSGETSGANQ